MNNEDARPKRKDGGEIRYDLASELIRCRELAGLERRDVGQLLGPPVGVLPFDASVNTPALGDLWPTGRVLLIDEEVLFVDYDDANRVVAVKLAES